MIEPLEALEKQGFEVTWLNSDDHGRADVEQLKQALRPDTLLVSIMASNNETGVRQPRGVVAQFDPDHMARIVAGDIPDSERPVEIGGSVEIRRPLEAGLQDAAARHAGQREGSQRATVEIVRDEISQCFKNII